MLRILIPTDFSDNSWNAISYGLQLFRRTKSIFYLLHINPIPPYDASETKIVKNPKFLEDAILNESKTELTKYADRIQKEFANPMHSFITMAAYDFFIDCIKKEILDKNIDLIIMGTKGASGLKKVALGSNTADVITRVQCNLLAIPENAKFRIPREIAFPTDYNLHFDVKVLDTLAMMAALNKSSLRIVHISKKGEQLTKEQLQNKELLHDYFRSLDHSFHILTTNKLETAVQCFVESRDIDMISMVAKNLNFFQRILFKPAIKQISYHTDIPFLVLHE